MVQPPNHNLLFITKVPNKVEVVVEVVKQTFFYWVYPDMLIANPG